MERLISLTTIDGLWSDYLAGLAELREGVQWVSLTGGVRDPIQNYFKFGGFDPFREYVKQVHAAARAGLCRLLCRGWIEGRCQRSVASTRSTITPDWPR